MPFSQRALPLVVCLFIVIVDASGLPFLQTRAENYVANSHHGPLHSSPGVVSLKRRNRLVFTTQPCSARRVKHCSFLLPADEMPLLALFVFLALPFLASSIRVAFHPPKASAPGWDAHVPDDLSADAAIGFTKSAVPPYRYHVKAEAAFSYTMTLPPGLHAVSLGFFDGGACQLRKRVFRVEVNNAQRDEVDIFAAVGCAKPYHLEFRGVPVDENGLLVVTLTRLQGYRPILSTIEVESDPNAPASPTPSPSVSREVRGGAEIVRVAFSKSGVAPEGWTLYNSQKLLPDTTRIGETNNQNIGPAAYRSHAWRGAGFSYEHLIEAGTYDIRLGFLEYTKKGCVKNGRVFKARVNGIETEDIDVFAMVGCRKVLDIWVYGVEVDDSRVLRVEIIKVGGAAPFLANFGAREGGGEIAREAFVNVGTDDNVAGTKIGRFGGTVEGGKLEGVWGTSRYGNSFEYAFELAPGTYDVELGFAETHRPFCMESGKRVFHVYVNGLLELESLDVFAKGGCYRAVEIVVPGVGVGVVHGGTLRVRFERVVSKAEVRYIRIRPAEDMCVPASSTGEVSGDHAAHSVPGVYPPEEDQSESYVDTTGSGTVRVQLDGSGSHSHFFDSTNNIIGEITQFSWSLVETGEVLSTKNRFVHDFPLGSTRLKLAVLDNSCTTDEAETTVTVTGKLQPGQYCYYYQGSTGIPEGGALLTGIKPMFAATTATTDLGFPSFEFDDSMFATRCQFFLSADTSEPTMKDISIFLNGSGDAQVYRGQDIILDSATSLSASISLAPGLTEFEVVYQRTTTSVVPRLVFKVDGQVPEPATVSHDRTTVLPILSAITPAEGRQSGNERVKLTGYGLFQPLTVSFGGNIAAVLPDGAFQRQFFALTPPATTSNAVAVTVTTAMGTSSDEVFFSYGGECDPVEFDSLDMQTQQNTAVDFLNLPTSAVLGHDGNIYMGTLGGTVQRLSYDVPSLKVTGHCYSKAIKDGNFTKNGNPASRDILGITLDPRDVSPRPYVSTSTLYWLDRKRLDSSVIGPWRNGAVDRLKLGTDPTDPSVCLVYDERIVSNLPVSNHDHSVNALVFTQQGDLLIAVGGFTNLGLPGWKLGNFWETDLSAAVLLAKLSSPAFNGHIEYSDISEPRNARQTGGDVSIFASGLRNAFAMAMTRSGEIYVSDQGPNCGFGHASTSCADYDAAAASQYPSMTEQDWQGSATASDKNCPRSAARPDKIVRLTRGGWYGHPNLQHGGAECAWIDPYDGRTATNDVPPESYIPPLLTLKSSITGIGQYHAEHFCGALRGELLLTKFKGAALYRMAIDEIDGASILAKDGGITFVENAAGDLVFPRLTQKLVRVMRPRRARQPGLYVVGAAPVRHGRSGGTKLTVAGGGFNALSRVSVGGVDCPSVRVDDEEIVCTVPRGEGLVDIVVTSAEGAIASLQEAVLYMEV